MKLSTWLLFLQSGCALHLLLLCRPSSSQECNTPLNLTQCMKYDQSVATGAVTCFPNGSLSVTISTSNNWIIDDIVTVRYTCRNSDGHQIKNGSLWDSAIFQISYINTETVEIMHSDSTCQVYSCYTDTNNCNSYSITMESNECSFKTAQTSIIPLPTVQSDLNDAYLVSPSMVTISTTSPAITASFGHQMSSVSAQISTTTLMLTTPLPSKGVPKETPSSNLATILLVVIVPAAGVTILLVILLCFVGYKHNHKLNVTKLYNTNEVFDPFFNPIDISVGTNVDLAQSLHSIYEGLRNDDHKSNIDSGTEDERSEILVTTVSDEKSSNASIIITEEDEQLNLNQCQTNSDIDNIQPKPHSLPSNSESSQAHPYSAGESSTECIPNSQTSTMVSVPSTSTGGIRSFSHSSSISGYITETEEASQASCPPSEVILLPEKQLGYTSKISANVKAQTSHIIQTFKPINSTESGYGTMHMYGEQFTKAAHTEGYVIDIGDNGRWRRELKIPVTITNSGCSSDSGVDNMQHFIPSDTSMHMDSINHDLLTTDHDVLPECNLSLNPLHFQPLDSYV